MTILVTGAAGFIGFHTCLKLLQQGHTVIGVDNVNAYYDISLKQQRLVLLGLKEQDFTQENSQLKSRKYPNFLFYKLNICERDQLDKVLKSHPMDMVIHLAAQAGVRYSIDHPESYIESNINGFFNVLEGCRNLGISKLVYASSSSVYGNTEVMPLQTSTKADEPISLYAATKRSNELMAHTYSHLFGLKSIGLRFFTVYGPLGRPDMAYFKFTKAILRGETIQVYNHGKQARDFTYIDDVTEGLSRVVHYLEKETSTSGLHRVYNLGKGKPDALADFIKLLELALNKKAMLTYVDAQPGDVTKTWADTTEFKNDFQFEASIDLKDGIKRFVDWYLNSSLD